MNSEEQDKIAEQATIATLQQCVVAILDGYTLKDIRLILETAERALTVKIAMRRK